MSRNRSQAAALVLAAASAAVALAACGAGPPGPTASDIDASSAPSEEAPARIRPEPERGEAAGDRTRPQAPGEPMLADHVRTCFSEDAKDYETNAAWQAVVDAGAEAVPLLIPWLEREEHAVDAVLLLGQLGVEEAVPPLLRWARAHPDEWWITEMALRSLGAAGNGGLVDLLQDPTPEMRTLGLQVLQNRFFTTYRPRIPEPLQAALLDCSAHADPDVREMALEAICEGVVPQADAAAAALAHLKDEDWAVRLAAIRLVNAVGPHAAACAAPLVELLASDDAETRRRAAGALGSLGEATPLVRDGLLRLAENGDADDCAWALRSLAGLGLDASPRLLRSPDPVIRSAAARAVTDCGLARDEQLQRLLPLLDDAEPGVRAAAAEALAAVGHLPPDVVAALVLLLHDRATTVRVQAARTLGGCREMSREELAALAALHDPDEPVQVRRAGAEAMARRLVDGAVESGALLPFLDDSNDGVVDAALTVLGAAPPGSSPPAEVLQAIRDAWRSDRLSSRPRLRAWGVLARAEPSSTELWGWMERYLPESVIGDFYVAIREIGRVDDRHSVDVLMRYSDSRRGGVVEVVCEALVAIPRDDARVIPSLRTIYRNARDTGRLAAVHGLGARSEDPLAREALVWATRDGDSRIRDAARKHLEPYR